MRVQHLFDFRTSSLTDLAYDEAEWVGVVIDSLLEPHDWTSSARSDLAVR